MASTLTAPPPTAQTLSAATVLEAAWMAAGSPVGDVEQEGVCARCRRAGLLAPVRAVVSKVFTGIDRWADPFGAGLCAACAWGYSTPELRQQVHLVDKAPGLQVLTRRQAGELLLGGALGTDQSLVVPLRAGRKHVLPEAVWGRVRVDDADLPWSAGQVELAGQVAWLRGLGFGPKMLAEPAPAFGVLAGLEPRLWGDVAQSWDALAAWRSSPAPWLALAVHVIGTEQAR